METYEYCYKYPKADTTASVIAYTGTPSLVNVVAIRRGKDPFKGQLALPGGFLEIGQETLELCAGRELFEETHLLARADQMKPVCVQSAPDRDPRGHVIDHVYSVEFFQPLNEIARAGDDAAAIEIITMTHDQFINTDYNFDANGRRKGGGWMDGWAFDHANSLYRFFANYFAID